MTELIPPDLTVLDRVARSWFLLTRLRCGLAIYAIQSGSSITARMSGPGPCDADAAMTTGTLFAVLESPPLALAPMAAFGGATTLGAGTAGQSR